MESKRTGAEQIECCLKMRFNMPLKLYSFAVFVVLNFVDVQIFYLPQEQLIDAIDR